MWRFVGNPEELCDIKSAYISQHFSYFNLCHFSLRSVIRYYYTFPRDQLFSEIYLSIDEAPTIYTGIMFFFFFIRGTPWKWCSTGTSVCQTDPARIVIIILFYFAQCRDLSIYGWTYWYPSAAHIHRYQKKKKEKEKKLIIRLIIYIYR